jgi:inosine-uridine nucleoside N-ribohydrolase
MVRAIGGVVALAAALVVLATACGTGARPELELTGPDAEVPTSVLVVTKDEADGSPDTDAEAGPSTAGRLALGPAATAVAPPRPVGPPLVVLDTDMGPDIDDALALGMLHTYQDRGGIELAAVTLSRNSEAGARFIDAVNTWYGDPDVPIGIDRRSPHTMVESDSYVSLADRWPNDLGGGSIPDGVGVLRRVLAGAVADGRPVTIVQVGFAGNVAALLDSGPDDVSPLSGPELVVESGAVLSVMAGSLDNPRIEFNVSNDVASARRVIQGWPGELVLSPFELGYDLHYPWRAVRDRLPGDDRHPIRQAYEFRDYDWHVDAPPMYDMRSWDLTSVMQAVEPDGTWFPVSDPGTVTIDGEGRTRFVPGDGLHRVLLRSSLDAGDLARIVDRMVELVSARPA